MQGHVEIARDADTVTLRAFAQTRFELVENASEAMFSVGYDLVSIPPTYSRPLVAPGDALPELLGAWLSELLALGIEEGIVWSQATVDRLEVGGVQGSAAGLFTADAPRHGPIVTGVRSVGTVVEVPDGFWIDVRMELDTGLRLV